MKKLGLIGFPLSHSFSKKYFSDKFSKENIKDYNYDLYPIERIEDIIKLIDSKIIGLNVTIPYKEQVIPFLDEISEEAKEIGAVNVIHITQVNNKPHLKGYNSDMYGFKSSFEKLLKPHHKSALILGTGGASKAVAYALKKLGIEYKFVSRKKQSNNLTYSELTKDTMAKYQIVINCTPLGTFPNINNSPDIPYKYITDKYICYDLVYNPDKTLFMKKSEDNGASIKNGYDMLTGQAEKAWEIWNR